jgi:hypothetical protein
LPIGWDEHGGLPVSQEAADASIRWVVFGIDLGLKAVVMPLGDGRLLAEWRYRERLLQIEWSSSGAGEYVVSARHEMIAEGALPFDPQPLFRFFLEDAQLALAASTNFHKVKANQLASLAVINYLPIP